MNVGSLGRRLNALEKPGTIDSAFLDVLAVENAQLNDSDLGLWEEILSLSHAGFSMEQIRGMVGEETYAAALELAEHVERERQKLEASPVRPERNGKPLKVPTS